MLTPLSFIIEQYVRVDPDPTFTTVANAHAWWERAEAQGLPRERVAQLFLEACGRHRPPGGTLEARLADVLWLDGQIAMNGKH